MSTNSVSFENGFGKTSFWTGFSTKSKVAFSKTEVLKKPQIYTDLQNIRQIKNLTT
jgi:hypothetical protein